MTKYHGFPMERTNIAVFLWKTTDIPHGNDQYCILPVQNKNIDNGQHFPLPLSWHCDMGWG